MPEMMQWLNKLEEATRIKGMPGYERGWSEDYNPLYGIDFKGLEKATRISWLPGYDREWTEGVSPLTGIDTEGMDAVFVVPIEEAVEEVVGAVEEKVEGVSMTQTVAGLLVLAGAIAVLTVGVAKRTPQAKAAGKAAGKVKVVISDAAD